MLTSPPLRAADLVLAFALLGAPPGTPEPTPPPAEYPATRAAVAEAAYRLDLVSADGRAGALAGPDRWQEDLDELRRRRLALEGAPELWHAGRLPPREVVSRARCALRQREEWLRAMAGAHADRAAAYTAAAAEAAARKAVWDLAEDAVNPHATPYDRRLALKGLREAVGERAWAEVWLPCPE